MPSNTIAANQFWNRIKQSKHFSKMISSAITYAYLDVSPQQNSRITEEICLNANSFTDVARLIYQWRNTLKSQDIIGFEMSDDEYREHKAALTSQPIITMLENAKNNTGVFFLDIGSGDGALTKDIKDQLQLQGHRVHAHRLDITSSIDWSTMSNETTTADDIEQHYYQGDNLDSAIAEMQSTSNKDDINVITYNHSLHHWPNAKAQEQSIKQLSHSIKEESVVVLKEHYNIMHDDILTLYHAFINFRIVADNARKQHLSIDTASEIINDYFAESAHNYISPYWLITKMQNHGFELATFTAPKDSDANKNVIYGFKKVSSDMPRVAIKAVDDTDAAMLHKKMLRFSLPGKEPKCNYATERKLSNASSCTMNSYSLL